MPTPTFDLQSHSSHSDGENSPTGVVDAAAAAGVELLALTDHDSVAGIAEAHTAAKRHPKLHLIDAVEISVRDPAGSDLHVCGYLIDPNDSALEAELARSRTAREQRIEQMIQALERLDFAVDRDRLARQQASGTTLGRPHLAAAAVAHADNRVRLDKAGLLDTSAFLEAYLIPGRPAFCPREAPSIARAIELIHNAGGVAVWAHPYWDLATDDEVTAALDRFVALGLDGVEAFYVTHTQAQTEFAARLCAERGLLSTGSSDFHGPNHRLFNRFCAFDTYGLLPNLGPLLSDQLA